MAAATVTSATLAVGGAVVTAPFKAIGLMTGDGDEEDEEDEETSED